MHLATGDIDVQYGTLAPGEAGVDTTVQTMVKLAKGKWGSRSAKIRAQAINIINAANVADKDYYGMAEAIHNWVRDQIRYVRDPIGSDDDGFTVNQETLSTPEETAFNSMAGDCDDKTILEMALLGSLGISSYPVVIGTLPDRRSFSHVYLHIVLPPGNYPEANMVIPADPIMRQWPLGKEASNDKVTTKKLYSELAGLGTMNLGAYASAPSYLARADTGDVVPALQSVLTDSASHGQIMTVDQVLRPSEDLDEMFLNPLTLATQPSSRAALRPRGPLVTRSAQKFTSYLSSPQLVPSTEGRVFRQNRPGPKIYTLKQKLQGPATLPAQAGPGLTDVAGLADVIDNLRSHARHAGRKHSYDGVHDVLNHAVAAMTLANAQARKARKQRDAQIKNLSMFGLGADTGALDQASQIEALAHENLKNAMGVAEQAAGASPVRQKAMHQMAGAMRVLDQGGKAADQAVAVAKRLPLHPVAQHAVAAAALVHVAHDTNAMRTAVSAVRMKAHLLDRAARPAKGLQPLVTDIPGAVVRDQFGRVLAAPGLAGPSKGGKKGGGSSGSTILTPGELGLGENIFKKAASAIGKAVSTAVKVAILPGKYISKLPGLSKLPSINQLFKKGGGGTAAGNQANGVSVVGPASSPATPSTPVTLQFTVTNTEAAADTFAIAVQLPPTGITATGYPTAITLQPNVPQTVSLTLQGDATTAGQTAQIGLSLTSTGSSGANGQAVVSLIFAAGGLAPGASSAIAVTPPPGMITVPSAGAQQQAIFTVANNQIVPDTFVFSIQAPGGVQVTGYPTSLSFLAGQSQQVTLSVTTDGTIPPGTDTQFNLVATSQVNAINTGYGTAQVNIGGTNALTTPVNPYADQSYGGSSDSGYDDGSDDGSSDMDTSDGSDDESQNDVTSTDTDTYGDGGGGDGSEAGPTSAADSTGPMDQGPYSPPPVDQGDDSDDSSYSEDGAAQPSYQGPAQAPPASATQLPPSILAQLSPAQLAALSPQDIQILMQQYQQQVAAQQPSQMQYGSDDSGDGGDDAVSGLGALSPGKAVAGVVAVGALGIASYLLYRHLKKHRRRRAA